VLNWVQIKAVIKLKARRRRARATPNWVDLVLGLKNLVKRKKRRVWSPK
jgi:hypothetical protein